MNQSDNEDRRRRIRARRTQVLPSQGVGSMDVELATLIEEHLPLVKHVVFQVAVQFPRHVDRDELARAGASAWSRRPVDTTKLAAYRSSALLRSAFEAPSSTPSAPPTGLPIPTNARSPT